MRNSEQRKLRITIIFNDDEEENMEHFCRAVKTILSKNETNEPSHECN